MIAVMDKDKKGEKSHYPRDLGEDDKLNFRSIPEVHAALSAIVNGIGKDKTLLFRGKPKPKRAQVVNALILYLETLDPAERRRVIGEGLERLNAFLAADQAGSGEGSEPTDESMPGGAKLTRRGNGRSDVG